MSIREGHNSIDGKSHLVPSQQQRRPSPIAAKAHARQQSPPRQHSTRQQSPKQHRPRRLSADHSNSSAPLSNNLHDLTTTTGNSQQQKRGSLFSLSRRESNNSGYQSDISTLAATPHGNADRIAGAVRAKFGGGGRSSLLSMSRGPSGEISSRKSSSRGHSSYGAVSSDADNSTSNSYIATPVRKSAPNRTKSNKKEDQGWMASIFNNMCGTSMCRPGGAQERRHAASATAPLLGGSIQKHNLPPTPRSVRSSLR